MARPQTNKSIRKNLDKDWSNSIKDRDRRVCAVCGKTSKVLNAHHIIPKTLKDTRYESMNGVSLCYAHHSAGPHSPHQNAVWFSLWIQKNRPEQYAWILTKLKEV
jgi:5-methylcytosine-specific restriction endonuclease McrA